MRVALAKRIMSFGFDALQPKKWNKQQLYSWRYDPREFSPAAAPTRDERRRNTRMDCEA